MYDKSNNPSAEEDAVEAAPARDKLILWFFRDILDEHRNALLRLFGVSDAQSHGEQRHALTYILAALSRRTGAVSEGDAA